MHAHKTATENYSLLIQNFMMLWYDKLWYFDKKKFLKAYDLLLFPEKRLNLILGVVHESHAGPVSAKAILKSFSYLFFYPTL